MTKLEFTSVTNIILSCEGFLLTGILLGRGFPAGSASFSWTLALAAVSLSSLIGGIDHGFFEPKGNGKARTILQRSTWIMIAVMTFFTERTMILCFASGGSASPLTAAAMIQLLLAVCAALAWNRFLFTVINYSLPMILFLICSAVTGKGGPWLPAGIVLSFAASSLQAAGVRISPTVDNNGLYHLVMMTAVFLFYKAAYFL